MLTLRGNLKLERVRSRKERGKKRVGWEEEKQRKESVFLGSVWERVDARGRGE